MRRIIIALLLVIVVAALWIWRGRDLSMFVDRFKTIDTSSRPIKTIIYEGSGTGGVLQADDLALSLNESELSGAQPNIGTTKDDQLALSFAGKVFPFGPLHEKEALAVRVPTNDTATISTQHSALSWSTFFEFNFMTGKSPSWKRNTYRRLTWKKPTGAKLEMVWRYEQHFYAGNGWTDGLMTRPGATGLIRVEISEAAR
jgi:hypothetical protein